MQHLQRSLLQILNFYVTVFLENTLFLWPFWNSVSSLPAGIDFFLTPRNSHVFGSNRSSRTMELVGEPCAGTRRRNPALWIWHYSWLKSVVVRVLRCFQFKCLSQRLGLPTSILEKKNMSWVHADCVEFSHPKNHLEKWYFLDLTWKPFLFEGVLRTKSASFLGIFSKAAEKKTEESHGSFGIFLCWDWTCNNSMNSLWVS